MWQWLKHHSKMSDGKPVSAELVGKIVDELGRPGEAPKLFKEMMTSADFSEFLTLAAYRYID